MPNHFVTLRLRFATVGSKMIGPRWAENTRRGGRARYVTYCSRSKSAGDLLPELIL